MSCSMPSNTSETRSSRAEPSWVPDETCGTKDALYYEHSFPVAIVNPNGLPSKRNRPRLAANAYTFGIPSNDARPSP